MTTNKTHSRVKSIISLFMVFVFAVVGIASVPAYAKKYEETDPEIIALRKEIEALKNDAAKAREQRQKLEGEIDDVSASAMQVQKEVDALQEEVDVYQSQINALNKQIKLLDNQIVGIEKSIKETEEKVAEQEKKIKETQKLLGERIRAMYMSGNVSSVELILEANSFESLLTRLELVSQVSKHDNKIVDDLKSEIKEMEDLKTSLLKQKDTLTENKKEIETSKADVVASQKEIKALKSTVDKKLSKLESYLSTLNKQDSQLAKLEQQAEAQQAAYSYKIDQMLAGKASQGSGSANLIWPVPYSSSYISSGYGRRPGVGVGDFHYGIDITMPGAESNDKKIIAAGDGTVLIASSICSHNYRKNYSCGCNWGFGDYVVIDHGDGVRAYYAHLSHVSVTQGQTVSQGQTIGYMGCTGYSTGWHLHFEIRVGSGSQSQTARNPLNYVSKP